MGSSTGIGRGTLLLSLCGLCALNLPGCKRRGVGGGSQQSYDVAPLLTALRPATRKELPRRLGLGSLSELPFYDLHLRAEPTSLKGRCTLHYRNRTGRPLPLLPLLLHPNAPRELGATDSGELQVLSAKALHGPPVKLVRRRPTFVELRFERPLRRGERALLEVRFSGRPRQLPAGSNDIFNQALASLGMVQGGSGASDYGLLAFGDGILTIASAYPMIAPQRDDGTFDTSPPTRFGDLAYNGIANYRVQTTLPAGYTLASNLKDGPPTSSNSKGKDVVVYTSVGAANRDLVIVAGPSLSKLEAKVGPITVRSFFLSTDRAGGQRVLDDARRSLRYFQQRYGDYPYTDLDIAEATIVGGAGGVEFPGMVLIAGMLYRKPSHGSGPLATLMRTLGGLGGLMQRLQGRAGQGQGRGLGGLQQMDEVVGNMAAFTVAHEVAHQYFAGLVGADVRRDPSVDEPLAQFAAGAYSDGRGGKAGGALEMNARMSYAVYRLVGGPDLPAGQAVSKFPSALAYAAIVYGKAPYFYVALRDKLGVERFDRMLRQAVDEQRFKIVTLQRWIATLERHAGGPSSGVKQLAQRWFYETHGDEDLKVDGSGDAVLQQLLGKATADELKRSLGMMGMKPGDLFRMLLGNAGGEKKRAPGLLDLLLGGGSKR